MLKLRQYSRPILNHSNTNSILWQQFTCSENKFQFYYLIHNMVMLPFGFSKISQQSLAQKNTSFEANQFAKQILQEGSFTKLCFEEYVWFTKCQ